MKTRIYAVMVGALLAFALASCEFLGPAVPTPPASAPHVIASAGEFEIAIGLNWPPVERAETYTIYRADRPDGEYEPIGETPYNSYRDEVGSGHTGRWYWYRVQACNPGGCGPISAPARGYAGPPPAPTNVRASDDRVDGVVITWDAIAGATEYEVVRDRARDGTYPTLVARVMGNSAEDATARPGLTYWYRVRARNRWGFGALSEPDPGCVLPCPGFPSAPPG